MKIEKVSYFPEKTEKWAELYAALRDMEIYDNNQDSPVIKVKIDELDLSPLRAAISNFSRINKPYKFRTAKQAGWLYIKRTK